VPSADADGQPFFRLGAYDSAVKFADMAITSLPA
jgi:hypothetical protein